MKDGWKKKGDDALLLVPMDDTRIGKLLQFYVGILRTQQQSLKPGTPEIRALAAEQAVALLVMGPDALHRLPPSARKSVQKKAADIRRKLRALARGEKAPEEPPPITH